jgi:hypothetical protein
MIALCSDWVGTSARAVGFIDWLGPPTVAGDGELEAGHGARNQHDA